jgi:hypothetical protein
MESQDNHHLSPEHASQESRPEHLEENTLPAPAPAAILKRLRLGRPSLLQKNRARKPLSLQAGDEAPFLSW